MMNKIKRLFSIFLSCVMILGLIPTTAFAQESDGYTFDSNSGALVILTESGITAWEGTVQPTEIKSVTVKGTVTELTGNVFQGLKNLETLVFEGAIRIQGVTVAEEGESGKTYYPFAETTKLSSITFGGSVELGARVFNYSSSSPNTALKELTFPEGSTFGAEVFKYCNNLETITFNGDVDLTAGYCFSNLNGLKNLNFKGESKISSSAFAYTSNLATITFGGKTELGGGAFPYGIIGSNNTALTELTFPAGSTFQGGVFGNCDNLKKITFAGDVVWPSGFFGNLPNLTTLDFQGESVLQSGVLAGTTKLAEIHFGGKTQILSGLFAYRSSPNTALKELTFPAGSEFGPAIFNNCTALKTITFEGDADVTAGGCFNNLSALTTLEFKGTSKISSSAFYGSTSSLTTIKFGDKTDVSNGEFSGSAVTELTFPEGSTFGPSVFNNCASLEKITFEGDADVTAGGCFYNLSALTTLEFKGTSKIGYNAFNGITSSLTTIKFGNKTDVGDNSFSGSAVTELTFPEGSTFGQNVFLNCTALEKITFEGDVDVSAGGCFSGSSALQTVVFKGESVLGGGSFANANKLKSIIFTGETTLKTKALVGVGSALEVMDPIVLPEGSMVAAEVFKELKISSVAFKDSTPQTFGADTFKDCPAGAKIIVPCGTVESYTAALNDGESPANPGGLAIEAGSKHIYDNGTCVCGAKAPAKSVTVTNGSGDGEYSEGVTVTIQADAPEEGKRFKCWTVISGGVTLEDASSSSTTFTMPGNAVEITAEYEAIPKYAVTVTNGEGTGEYKQGDTVTITAAAPETGKQFKEWTVGKGNVTLANSTSATTTFTMPAEEVSVTAVYKDKSSSGGSTGGGSGSTGGGSSSTSGETSASDPNTTTETKPDGTKVETKTETKTDGTKVETVTETKTDGTKVETVTETKTDGTKVETSTETKTDGSKVETSTETKADGGKTETVVETAKDGSVKTTETVTKTDGSATKTEKESETNTKGKEVVVTTTTQTDSTGAVTSVTEKSVIGKSSATTSTTVTVKKDGEGTITSASANVVKTVSSGNKATVSAAIVSQIVEAAGTESVSVTITVKDSEGNTKYKVKVEAENLQAGENLYIYKLNTKTGEYTMVNAKTYKVNESGNVAVSMTKKATYQLVTAEDAAQIDKQIKSTIKPKKASADVKQGKSTDFALSSKANEDNIKAITYTTSKKSVATVSKDGKITAKGKGTVTIKAKVTLKNGSTKTIKMTIKVK